MALNVVTYNMNGFNTSVAYVKQLSKNYDIILVQEHMVRGNDIQLFASSAPDLNLFFTSAEQHDNIGRPSGVHGILVNKYIKVVKDLSSSINRRVSAVY